MGNKKTKALCLDIIGKIITTMAAMNVAKTQVMKE
jgi:hypothetical protein